MDLDICGCVESFRNSLGFEGIDEVMEAGFNEGLYGALESGRISADEFRAAVLDGSRLGKTASDVDAAFGKILKGMDSYKADMLRRLSARYELYMLSNNNPICLARAREIFNEAGIPLEEIFKKTFMSFEMKMLKPEAGIFYAAVREIGVPADQVLFIDDVPENVKGAENAGLQAVLYEPGTDLDALLEERLEGLRHA